MHTWRYFDLVQDDCSEFEKKKKSTFVMNRCFPEADVDTFTLHGHDSASLKERLDDVDVLYIEVDRLFVRLTRTF